MIELGHSFAPSYMGNNCNAEFVLYKMLVLCLSKQPVAKQDAGQYAFKNGVGSVTIAALVFGGMWYATPKDRLSGIPQRSSSY